LLAEGWRRAHVKRCDSAEFIASLILDYAEDERRKLEAGISVLRVLPRGAAQHNRGIKRNQSITHMGAEKG
jgi:hypothetical protein